MKRRLKALDGLITELGNMEYEDLETRRFRQPSSLSEGEAGARTSERTSTSLPTGGNRPASRPPEYKANVGDVSEAYYEGSPGRERFDTPAQAQGVPRDERPVERNNEQGAGRFPVMSMSAGRGKIDVPPTTAAHETQHGKTPMVTEEPPPVIKRARRRASLKV